MPKQNGQHGTARAPKQRARKCASCTHSGVNRTRKGYGRQCPAHFGAIPASEKIQFSGVGLPSIQNEAANKLEQLVACV
jgi:hypothetical protein